MILNPAGGNNVCTMRRNSAKNRNFTLTKVCQRVRKELIEHVLEQK